MDIFRHMMQIAILFLFYGLGILIQKLVHLPIPGSVIGMIFLFLCLISGKFNTRLIEMGAQFMIRHLVLFFIPATVGIITYYTIFYGKGAWLIIIAVASTYLVMLMSGWSSQWLVKMRGVDHE